MKKILLAISAMLSLAACNREIIEPLHPVSDDGNIVLDFSIVVPEAQEATKSISSPAITSLTVIAFDEYGYFVTAAAAEDVNGWGVTSAETEFTVELPQAASARKLHFVANCPKAVNQFTYGHETDIMTGLVTTENNDAYWQCREVNSLLVQDRDSLNAQLQNIPMIRNYAKIRIGKVVDSFTLTGYAVIDAPTSGTVVPYNLSSGSFQPFDASTDYNALKTARYSSFMPEGVSFDFNAADNLANLVWTEPVQEGPLPAVYTYESSPSEKNETALLIRGKYNGSQTDTYYKVALYDAANGTYDILRNIEYTVNITNVVGAGYGTALEAVKAVAGNNISASTVTKNLLNISNGTQRLYVEYTAKRVVSTDPFTLKYKFMPFAPSSTQTDKDVAVNKLHPQEGFDYGTPGNPSDREPITITRRTTSEDGKPVVTSLTIENQGQVTDDEGFSTIMITPRDTLPTSGVWSEEITITSTFDNTVLSRTVTLYMLNPYVMTVSCNGRVAKQAGQDVDVNINLPASLPDEIFPLVFDIEAAKMSIYPNTTSKAVNILDEVISMPVVSGKSIIPAKANGSSTFHFQRTLTKEEYDALEDAAGESAQTVAVPCYFRTNIDDSETAIYVYNEYFNLADCSFVTYEANFFTNLSFPNGVKAVAGSPTTFNFTIASDAPQSMTVTLNGLVPASTETKLTKVAGTENKYTYSNPGTGNKTLSLLTVNPEGTVSVELEADEYDYAPASLSAEQANEIIIPAGNITFDLHDSTQRNVSVYLNSSYSGTALITISNVRDNSTYASELNLGKVTENQVVYFRYQVQSYSWGGMSTTNYTASATVAQLKAGYTLVFSQQ